MRQRAQLVGNQRMGALLVAQETPEQEVARGAGVLTSGGNFSPTLAAPSEMVLGFAGERHAEANMTEERFESRRDYFLEDVHENPLLWTTIAARNSNTVDDLASNVILGLGGGFFQGLAEGVNRKHLREFTDGLEQWTNARAFSAGIKAGVLLGAVKDLYNNIAFLLELAFGAVKLGTSVATAMQPGAVALTSIRFMFNIGDYRDETIKDIEDTATAAGEITDELRGLLESLAAEFLFSQDPLLNDSQEFGAAVGRMVAERANADVFAERSYFSRGRALGEVIGIVLTEIVLLFVAVEVAIAKGLVNTARGARILAKAQLLKNARIADKVGELLRNKPRLRKLLGLGDDVGDIGRVADGTADAGAAARASTEPPTSSGTPEPKQGTIAKPSLRKSKNVTVETVDAKSENALGQLNDEYKSASVEHLKSSKEQGRTWSEAKKTKIDSPERVLHAGAKARTEQLVKYKRDLRARISEAKRRLGGRKVEYREIPDHPESRAERMGREANNRVALKFGGYLEEVKKYFRRINQSERESIRSALIQNARKENLESIMVPHVVNGELVIEPVPIDNLLTQKTSRGATAYQLGHILDYAESVDDALRLGFSRQDWIDFQRNPSLYRFEHVSFNSGRKGDISLEKLLDKYYTD